MTIAGKAYPMTVHQAKRDQVTGNFLGYILENPDGTVYKGGKPVEVSCLESR